MFSILIFNVDQTLFFYTTADFERRVCEKELPKATVSQLSAYSLPKGYWQSTIY